MNQEPSPNTNPQPTKSLLLNNTMSKSDQNSMFNPLNNILPSLNPAPTDPKNTKNPISTKQKRTLIKRNDFDHNPHVQNNSIPMFCMKRELSTTGINPDILILENSGEIDSTCKRMKTEKDMSLLLSEFKGLQLDDHYKRSHIN
jgi:hypothetical protein